MGEIKCVYCNSDLSDVNKQCPECGKFPDKFLSSYTADTERKIVTRHWWLYFILVFMLIILYEWVSKLDANVIFITLFQTILAIFIIYLSNEFIKAIKSLIVFFSGNKLFRRLKGVFK